MRDPQDFLIDGADILPELLQIVLHQIDQFDFFIGQSGSQCVELTCQAASETQQRDLEIEIEIEIEPESSITLHLLARLPVQPT